MLPRAEPPGPSAQAVPSPAPCPPPRVSRAASLVSLLALLSALAAVPAPARAQDASPLDPDGPRSRPQVRLVGGGPEFPVVGGGGLQPQLAGYLSLGEDWQAGIKLAVDPASSETAYDWWPEAGLHLRRLWLSDQDTSTVADPEYISLVVGAYPAYGFQGREDGPRPFAGLALGKLWMPFAGVPYGLDFFLELTRYFDGHPPGKPRNHFLSAGVNLFLVLP